MLGNDRIKFTQFSFYNPKTSPKKVSHWKLRILKKLQVIKGLIKRHSEKFKNQKQPFADVLISSLSQGLWIPNLAN